VVATPLSPTKNDCTMSVFLSSQYLGFVDYPLSKAASFGSRTCWFTCRMYWCRLQKATLVNASSRFLEKCTGHYLPCSSRRYSIRVSQSAEAYDGHDPLACYRQLRTEPLVKLNHLCLSSHECSLGDLRSMTEIQTESNGYRELASLLMILLR